MRKILLVLIGIFFITGLTLASASRLPAVDGDSDVWGTILNDYLLRIAGLNATELNQTMVSGTNIYPNSINTTHLIDGTITSADIGTDSITDDKIDYTNVTLSDFTNDANYLDKDIGGIIDGAVVINGNLSLIGSYLNATVTNQYLNGSFFPDMTNIFDIGSSLFRWKDIYATNVYLSGILNVPSILSNDWTNVTITESQVSDADWWDADEDVDADEISESKIGFSTACAAGSHLYIDGNDLACEVNSINGTNISVLDINASSATIHGDLNVTGTSYLGSMNLAGGNISATTGNFTTLYVGDANVSGVLSDISSNNYAQYQFDDNNFNGGGNFTTTGYGFFGWLGNLASKITSIFATTIHTDVLNSTGTIYSNQTCYTQDCSAKIYYNGTGLIITS